MKRATLHKINENILVAVLELSTDLFFGEALPNREYIIKHGIPVLNFEQRSSTFFENKIIQGDIKKVNNCDFFEISPFPLKSDYESIILARKLLQGRTTKILKKSDFFKLKELAERDGTITWTMKNGFAIDKTYVLYAKLNISGVFIRPYKIKIKESLLKNNIV